MLYTNLKHIETRDQFASQMVNNTSVVVVCGRMDTVCIPVYRNAEQLEVEYPNVHFFDMEIDNPELDVVHSFFEVQRLNILPFILYFKNGKLALASSGSHSLTELRAKLDRVFNQPEVVNK